jgi:hypothetical protein
LRRQGGEGALVVDPDSVGAHAATAQGSALARAQ